MTDAAPKNEGEYLKLANDLKEQFTTHKRETAVQLNMMRARINHLVDTNTELEHKNMRLRRTLLIITEKFASSCHPLQ